MAIGAISTNLSQALDRASAASGLSLSRKAQGPAEAEGFGSLLAQEMSKVTASASAAQGAIEAYSENPEGVPLERVSLLMATAESDLRFAAQLRNKTVSAYQEVMGMQL